MAHRQTWRNRAGSVYHRKDTSRWVADIIDLSTGKRVQKYVRSGQKARQKREEAMCKTKQSRFFASLRGSFRRERKQ